MNILSKLLLVGGVNDAADPTRNANAWASIGLNNGQLDFTASGESITQNGGQSGGIGRGSGDIDISSFSKGDVNLSVYLEDEIWNAGYRFPGDIYQAVAIAYYPPGSTTTPPVSFGQENWPAEFDAPGFSEGGKRINFVDKDDDVNVYEYSIAVIKPGGERVVLDPKIKNGGQD